MTEKSESYTPDLDLKTSDCFLQEIGGGGQKIWLIAVWLSHGHGPAMWHPRPSSPLSEINSGSLGEAGLKDITLSALLSLSCEMKLRNGLVYNYRTQKNCVIKSNDIELK